MYNFPIGVIIDSFKKDVKSAIAEAKKIEAQGLQMYVTKGENSFEVLVGNKRRELLNYVKDNGLKFSALCGDLGHGFMNPELNPMLIEKSKRILDMSKEMECGIVTTHIGVVPEDKSLDRYKIMQDACFKLAEYADSIDAHFAVETGGERSIVLKEFLDSLGSKGVGVNFDPANLAMVFDDDIIDSVYDLKDYIVHTHAKDGYKIKDCNIDEMFGVVPQPAGWKESDYCLEVPLGQGSVDFKNYLKALEDIGYKGFLTIERECGENPTADIHTAANYLREVISKY